jgi:hypothetical protein
VSKKVYNYECPEHGVFSAIVEYCLRDTAQKCPLCTADSPRTWQDAAPTVLRASYHDGVGRFDGLKKDMELRKAQANAKARGNFKLEKEIKKERQDRNQ